MDEVSFWRVHCHIGQHPGQWQNWFKEQCCAVGWPPSNWNGKEADGWSIDDPSAGNHDFKTTMGCLRRMKAGDWIVATLPGNRIGRIGRITALAVEDREWNPILPPDPKHPSGENGRRILVRWDLNSGPSDASKVVLLPPDLQFKGGHIRGTARSIPMSRLEGVLAAMKDEANWVSLGSSFKLETALSGYIALHPHRLEDGLVGHPSLQANELTFPDGTRADVLLQDRDGRVVVVECKQGAATVEALGQLRGYLLNMQAHYPSLGSPRGILVHGGSQRTRAEVTAEAQRLDIDLVYCELQVNFASSRLR